MSSERIEWIDTLKFLGILFITIGHLGDGSGLLYRFVYLFHVPLFFFLSGVFHRRKNKMKTLIQKKFTTLLVPYFLLSVISCIIFYFRFPGSEKSYTEAIKAIFFGIRNTTFYAEGLWFFPCLFLISIIFEIILLISKRKSLVTLLISFSMFYLISIVPNKTPAADPQFIFNIDSAVYYIIYYCAGYYSSRILINIEKINSNLIYLVTTFCLLLVAIYYSNGVAFIYNKLQGNKFANSTATLLISASIILSMIFFSITLSKIKITSFIGRQTLVICGTENISKGIILSVITMLGINFRISTPLMSICFALAVIGLSCVINKYILSKYKYF